MYSDSTATVFDRKTLKRLEMTCKRPNTTSKVLSFAFVPLLRNCFARFHPSLVLETQGCKVTENEKLVDLRHRQYALNKAGHSHTSE